MSDPARNPGRLPRWFDQARLELPTVPEALARLLLLLVVALCLNAFVLQPYLIPSGSMERTLLVGDFLLVNKQVYAPADRWSRWLMPYREVERGDIVIFHHSLNPYLVKRVIGLPGDRLRIADGRVSVNGALLDEPYAAFESANRNPQRDDFPASIYSDPNVEMEWWRQMQGLTHNGELTVPEGEYFVMGDNRDHSDDSRFWGFVARRQIVARPLVVYFSLARPMGSVLPQADVQDANDKLGDDRQLSARLQGFARWKRIFHVVR